MAPASPATTWERGVELGARGRYAEAAEHFAELLGVDDRWKSLALSSLASHRRQIGDAVGAADLDAVALLSATDAESCADALIGLAADAVASGDPARATVWHVESAEPATSGWRTLTRWHWVGAELALLAGDEATATEHAQRAIATCLDHSVRHAVKSRIVLAAVTGDIDDLVAVRPILSSEGWVTLEWPLALVAADHGGSAELPPSPSWPGEAWEAGRVATYTIEECLPAALQPVWRSHPGVQRLREDGLPSGGE